MTVFKKYAVKSLLHISVALFFLCISSTTSLAQSKINVVGTVVDSAGSPVAGVTVAVEKNQKTSTATDANGKFVIDVPSGSVLVLTAVNFETFRITVTESTKTPTISLKSKQAELGEVVVTAYGKRQRKEAVVGSVTSISAKELKIPSSNLTTAFAGRLAGVIAYQRSGEPGADNATFFVRGVTTFGNGSGNPLILIDNIELTSTDLARLQPDDIESFSILKDASATSLYGARGANGVIFVTTKSGKAGKSKLNLRLENSISQPTQKVKIADPITYMEGYTEAQLTRNPLERLDYQQNQIDHTKAGDNKYVYPATDWFDLMFKDRTSVQRANVSITGGGDVATYYVSGSYNVDHGILNVDKRNDFNSNVKLGSYQLRTNVDIRLTPTTNLSFKIFGIFDDYKGPIDGGTGTYLKALRSSPSRFAPYYPPDDANIASQHILFGNNIRAGSFYINPYAEMVRGYKESSKSRMVAQFDLKQNLKVITPGLNFSGLFSTNRYSSFAVSRAYGPYYYNVSTYDRLSDKYVLTWLNDPSVNNGVSGAQFPRPHEDLQTLAIDNILGRELNTQLYAQGTLDYSREFADKHTVGATVVATMQQNLNTTLNFDLQSSLPHRNMGLSGRASYSFDTRYFAEFNFGYNGSERFYRDKQFGFFPTFGVSWMVSNEKFWKGALSDKITKLKLRGSYGLVGNDAIGRPEDRFYYLSQVNLNDGGRGASFGYDNNYSRNGVSVQRYPNFEITWEKSYQTNLALEIGLFNKFNIVAEIYNQDRKNILMSRASIPSTMGLDGGTPQANVGEARSRGIDLSLDYKVDLNKDTWITARASFTYSRGEFTVYEEPAYADKYLLHRGQSLSQQWGLIAERLFIDDKDVLNSPKQNFGLYQAGDIKYRDVNGDGQITSLDFVPIGDPATPEITYGFGASGGFKNFDLSIFFQGLARESFWIDPYATAPFVDYDDPNAPINGAFRGENALLQEYANSHWSEENRNSYAVWPRFSVTPLVNNTLRSTWFMRDGSFLRVKSVELGYTLPIKLVRRYKISNLRVYLSGTNLFTFSKFDLWDPEMGGNGLGYPIQKVVNAGLMISF